MGNKSTASGGAKKLKFSTYDIVGMGLLTAIIVVLQALTVGIKFGTFNITFVLVPIVVGAALYGKFAGAWLGFVFGVMVLLSGDAAAFLAINVPGTIVTVLLKGTLAGFVAGFVYRLVPTEIVKGEVLDTKTGESVYTIVNRNELAPAIWAGIAAPVVNTGLFLIGCSVFFMDTIKAWGEGAGFADVGTYMIVGLVGINFVVELAINLVLSSAIVRIVKVGRAKLRKA